MQTDAMDQWYEELPLANVSESTKSIYQALKQFNHCKADYKKRLYFLEKIHETVINNAENLKTRIIGRKLPLDKKQQRIAILVRELHKQMVIGYTAVLQNILHCPLGFLCVKAQKQRARVIQRIMRHISFILLNDYQLYVPPAKGLWSTLHQLFLLAENRKLCNKKITDSSFQLITSGTIKQTYLQILLLAIADPYRMSQLHISTIFKQLEEWAQLADVLYDPGSDLKDSLHIDLSTDLHPGLKTSDDITDQQSSRILETSRLEYSDLVSNIEQSTDHSRAINATLLRQLSLTWGIPPSRQHNRQKAQKSLKVAIGINNTHYVLSGYNEPVWMKTGHEGWNTGVHVRESTVSTTRYKARNIESSFQSSDVWKEIFQEHNTEPYSQKINLDNDPLTLARNIKKGIHDWRIINTSDGGYCLSWEHSEAINVKVGEIVSLKQEEPDGISFWSVGIIRWIKCMHHHAVHMGIQILVPNAVPVTITKLDMSRERIKNRAILLPMISSRHQPKTLITAALGYVENDKVLLIEDHPAINQMNSTHTKLTLTDTLEHSAHFSRFKFTIFEQENRTENLEVKVENAGQSLPLEDGTEFDSLWDDL